MDDAIDSKQKQKFYDSKSVDDDVYKGNKQWKKDLKNILIRELQLRSKKKHH